MPDENALKRAIKQFQENGLATVDPEWAQVVAALIEAEWQERRTAAIRSLAKSICLAAESIRSGLGEMG